MADEYEYALRQERRRLEKECRGQDSNKLLDGSGTKEGYSVKKVVGSRCCARSEEDNTFYWGWITQKARRLYTVRHALRIRGTNIRIVLTPIRRQILLDNGTGLTECWM
jgi:hypothetical protein